MTMIMMAPALIKIGNRGAGHHSLGCSALPGFLLLRWSSFRNQCGCSCALLSALISGGRLETLFRNDTDQPRPFNLDGNRLEIGNAKTWQARAGARALILPALTVSYVE
jgi:hypothetical protein